MANIKNNNGEISKTAYERVSGHGYGFYTIKLSDLYNSRSTNLHSIYFTDLFIIEKRKEAIVAAGFHPLTKAIISLNTENDVVKEILQKEMERKAQNVIDTNKIEASKIALKEAIRNEAESIIIDEDFKTALKYAAQVEGKEKSDRMASAFKGLLQRNNIDKVNTDFWQVFRILKAKAEA